MDKEKAFKISKSFFFIKKNFLADKSTGFLYWRYRILRPILKIYTKFQRSFYKPSPWTTPASIKIFDTILTGESVIFEYGSGSSTLFFKNKVKQIISVDHHEGWFNKISKILSSENIKNVEYHLIQKEFSQNEKDVTHLNLEIPDLRVKTWYASYFNFINQFDDESFDFVLIDGRARVECAINAKNKVKPGGVLVLDNSERSRYRPVFDYLSEWDCLDTTNGLTNTTMWFKPHGNSHKK